MLAGDGRRASPTSSSERAGRARRAGRAGSHAADLGRVDRAPCGSRPSSDGDVSKAEGRRRPWPVSRRCSAARRSVWVDLAGPSSEQVESVGKALGLHPLIVEDVLEGNQRAKIETTDGVVHIVLFAPATTSEVAPSEVDIVLGPGFLLTAHDGTWDPRATHHLRGAASSRSSSTAPTTCSGRSPTTSSTAISRSPTGSATPSTRSRTPSSARRRRRPLEQLFALKRELIEVRRSIGPVREVFNQLTNRDVALIDEEELVWFRDMYDHVIRLTDELDNYRELASATLDVYLTRSTTTSRSIMKRLTGRDGHPRRDRRGRRHLRHERGGDRARWRRGRRVLARHGGRAVAGRGGRVVLLRRIDWI